MQMLYKLSARSLYDIVSRVAYTIRGASPSYLGRPKACSCGSLDYGIPRWKSSWYGISLGALSRCGFAMDRSTMHTWTALLVAWNTRSMLDGCYPCAGARTRFTT